MAGMGDRRIWCSSIRWEDFRPMGGEYTILLRQGDYPGTLDQCGEQSSYRFSYFGVRGRLHLDRKQSREQAYSLVNDPVIDLPGKLYT